MTNANVLFLCDCSDCGGVADGYLMMMGGGQAFMTQSCSMVSVDFSQFIETKFWCLAGEYFPHSFSSLTFLEQIRSLGRIVCLPRRVYSIHFSSIRGRVNCTRLAQFRPVIRIHGAITKMFHTIEWVGRIPGRIRVYVRFAIEMAVAHIMKCGHAERINKMNTKNIKTMLRKRNTYTSSK